MKVAKWGNSLAVRLPAALVAELGLKENDEIDILAASRESLTVGPAPTLKERLLELRKYRGSLPADFKFDREEANAR